MLAASAMSSCAAITESLKFLSKVLHLVHKATGSGRSLGDVPHLRVLLDQVSGLSRLPTKQLSAWVARVVIGFPSDNPAEVGNNTSLLRKLVEILAKEERCVRNGTA